MNILFTICGRAGSKGFKNKNLKEMNGVPLVYYTLAVIKLYTDRHQDDHIMIALNTDSSELECLVRKQHIVDCVKCVNRKEELAGDLVPKVEVIKDTFITIMKENDCDIVVDLDLTSPLRSVGDIENAIREYYNNDDYDLVFSAVDSRRNPYFNMVEKKDDFYHRVCLSDFSARQQAPNVYEMNASIYVYSPQFLLSEIDAPLTDYRCGVSTMKDYLVLDIDSEEDFKMMEFLHRNYIEDDAGLREVFEKAKWQ